MRIETVYGNGKVESEMTKDEIINAILEDAGVEGSGDSATRITIDSIRQVMDKAFGAGWHAGDDYANKIARLNYKKYDKQIAELRG